MGLRRYFQFRTRFQFTVKNISVHWMRMGFQFSDKKYFQFTKCKWDFNSHLINLKSIRVRWNSIRVRRWIEIPFASVKSKFGLKSIFFAFVGELKFHSRPIASVGKLKFLLMLRFIQKIVDFLKKNNVFFMCVNEIFASNTKLRAGLGRTWLSIPHRLEIYWCPSRIDVRRGSSKGSLEWRVNVKTCYCSKKNTI